MLPGAELRAPGRQMTGEPLELAKDAGALLVVIGALAEVEPSGEVVVVSVGDGVVDGDVGGGVVGGGVVGGFVGEVDGGLVDVVGLLDGDGLPPGFDELGDGSTPGFDGSPDDGLELGVAVPVASGSPPGRLVEPTAGSSASQAVLGVVLVRRLAVP